MTTHMHAAQHLASALVCGRWEINELIERGGDAFGKRWRWLRPLAQRLVLALGENRRPSRCRVLKFLR